MFANLSAPRHWPKLRARLVDAWQRRVRWDVFSTPEYLDPERFASPSVWVWVRILLWETRSFVQRMRFARERLSVPKQTPLPFLCQTCSEAGCRFCYNNVGRYMLHIEELQKLCPWLGWVDKILLAETWAEALDKACCSLGSAKTLRHPDCGPLEGRPAGMLSQQKEAC